MLSLIRSWIRGTEGVSVVEFALMAPIILFLCIGVVDFGMFLHEKMKLENMAQASVDYLINGGGDDNVYADVISAYEPTLGSGSVSPYQVEIDLQCECNNGVSVNCSLSDQCSAATGGYRRRFYFVSVSRTRETLIPYYLLPSTIQLEGTARIQMD